MEDEQDLTAQVFGGIWGTEKVIQVQARGIFAQWSTGVKGEPLPLSTHIYSIVSL